MIRLDISEDSGQITIATTQLSVSAKPLGNPNCIYFTNRDSFDDKHVFVRYENGIRAPAPTGANGYSIPSHYSFVHEVGKRDLPSGDNDEEYLIPVQYYKISKNSLDSLIKS